ncbi:MAG: hypothetical protein QNJ92_06660 [Alphaproteobacteria bacterium]|nr:hypothetical protein [Alphaproteobacteria bacterium]
MPIKDAVDLFITATEKIEFYWNFYVVMLIALVGWLITTKRAFSTSMKILITVGCLVFVAMNLLGLDRAYRFAEALRTDILAMDGADALARTREVFSSVNFELQQVLIFPIHLVLAVVVLSVVWFRRGDAQKPKGAGG